MKLEKKRRQEGCQAPWLAELGGGGELVLETRSGEAVWLADRCMGYGVEERCWAQSPSGWGESDGHSSGINALEGMARGGAREQLQHAGVGSCLSRAETWRTGLPTWDLQLRRRSSDHQLGLWTLSIPFFVLFGGNLNPHFNTSVHQCKRVIFYF